MHCMNFVQYLEYLVCFIPVGLHISCTSYSIWSVQFVLNQFYVMLKFRATFGVFSLFLPIILCIALILYNICSVQVVLNQFMHCMNFVKYLECSVYFIPCVLYAVFFSFLHIILIAIYSF